MAIVVVCPARIGPGYRVTYSGLSGPTALDDIFSVAVREPSLGLNFLTAGLSLVRGSTSGSVIMGIAEVSVIADGLDRYLAPGATVQAEWTHFDAAFSVIASGTVGSLLWEPTGGVGALLTQLGQASAGSKLGEILAAVKRTFPATTQVSLPVGIIDGLAFPPLGVLNPVLDTSGPYAAGDYNLDQFTTGGAMLLPAGTYQVHGTYGVIVVPNGAIPTTWGYSTGYDSGSALGHEGDVYENRFCQLVPQHQVVSGFYLPIEYLDVRTIPAYLMWPFRLIGGDRLGLHVTPGVSVDLYYLCVL